MIGRQSRLLKIVVALVLGFTGCQHTQETKTVIGPPAKHSVRSERLLVQSDFQLPKNNPLITDLIRLRGQVSQTLELP